ncbi:MAG: cytochrome c nitrite reductase small subunit [Calditrichaeota bacterium]|nr:MAG: cytochrome c nitrite reductase small subunit [Calditrichota bacterium]MBL1204664.1 cytochrome c nitrite reductase small subunit [Calditrichota bacterium]NOG44492.1 cytochrome c nitrite reductase small subunit [Calditrichota bacterium]
MLSMAILLLIYMLNTAKAFSYLSAEPTACINCHVMNTQYATWQHSSHALTATCVDCHLPNDGTINKYMAKARDGWNHTVAFTFDTYEPVITISDDAAKRVQKNCIGCHKSITTTLVGNADRNHSYNDDEVQNGRKCWDCHRGVPHGKVRGLTTTPNNLGIKEVN